MNLYPPQNVTCFGCTGKGWFDAFGKPCDQNDFFARSMCTTCNGIGVISSSCMRCRICSGFGAFDSFNKPTKRMINYYCPGCKGACIDTGMLPCKPCNNRGYTDEFNDPCDYDDAYRTCATCGSGQRIRRPGVLGFFLFFCS